MERWACEELNLGPHAYQARHMSRPADQLRTDSHVAASCATPKRTQSAPKNGTGAGQPTGPTPGTRPAFDAALHEALAGCFLTAVEARLSAPAQGRTLTFGAAPTMAPPSRATAAGVAA